MFMKPIERFITYKFKQHLTPTLYTKYLDMARFLDSMGNEALVYTPQQAYEEYYRHHGGKLNPLVGLFPTLEEWTQFLNNEAINYILTQLVIKSKSVVLRKLIGSIDEHTNLSHNDMKALNALKDLIEIQTQDEGVVYIQYLAPMRFENVDPEQVLAPYLETDKTNE